MIVVDTNVIAYLYLPSSHTVPAEELFMRDSQWAAPILWRSEFRNILAGYIRRKVMSLEQACAVQKEAAGLLEGLEFEVSSEAVLSLVAQSDCSAYDCEFAVLADQLDVQLVTMDAKLLRAFPSRAVGLP